MSAEYEINQITGYGPHKCKQNPSGISIVEYDEEDYVIVRCLVTKKTQFLYTSIMHDVSPVEIVRFKEMMKNRSRWKRFVDWLEI